MLVGVQVAQASLVRLQTEELALRPAAVARAQQITSTGEDRVLAPVSQAVAVAAIVLGHIALERMRQEKALR